MEQENIETISLEDLAELLKKARKIREEKTGEKITHQMIADAIGVDRVSVTLWEQGKRHPGFLNILKYCQFLGITVDELMGVKTNRTLQLELTEEERTVLLATVDACEQQLTVSDMTTLRQTFYYLKQHLKALFSRAHRQ